MNLGFEKNIAGPASEGLAQDRLLKVPEVQKLLGYSRATVYRLIGEGKLPVVRVAGTVRFRYQSMLKWMIDHETPAAEPTRISQLPDYDSRGGTY
jgi:excisionase family DNA binding protein